MIEPAEQEPRHHDQHAWFTAHASCVARQNSRRQKAAIPNTQKAQLHMCTNDAASTLVTHFDACAETQQHDASAACDAGPNGAA